MTTIVGIQGDGFAVIGYDSRVSGENGRIYVLPKDTGKVVRNGNYLLGAAGDLRAINLLADIELPDPEELVGKKLDKFFSTQVVPRIRTHFERHGYGRDGSQSSDILVCISGIIYEIAENYDCNRDAFGIYGVGSGSDYAVGALHTLVDGDITVDAAKLWIKAAMKIALRLDSGSGNPVNIVVQQNS